MSRRSVLACDWRGCTRRVELDGDSAPMPPGWAEFRIRLMHCDALPEGFPSGPTLERSIVACPKHRNAVMFGAVGQPPTDPEPAERATPPRLGRGRRSQVGPPDDDGA